MAKLTDYRRWVLSHWRNWGWCQPVDRILTKKGRHEISMLLKKGLLEQDEYGMYRITDAGRAALAEGGRDD